MRFNQVNFQNNIMTKGSLLFTLILIYLVGWFFQYLSVITVTQTNYILIISSSIFCAQYYRTFPNVIYFIWISLVLYIFLGLLLLESNHLIPTLVYIYYSISLILSILFGFILGTQINKIPQSFYLSYLLFQVFIASFQYFYTDIWLGNTHVKIDYIDAISGSFFLSSDASLVFLVSSLLIVLRNQNPSFVYSLSIVILSTTIVYFTNSSAGTIFYIIALVYFLQYSVTKYFTPIKILYFIVPVVILPFIIPGVDHFLNDLFFDFYTINFGRDASRLAPLGFLFFEEISFLGSGPLYYYNPISKDWLFNSGFSVVYSYYLDFGLIGLLLIYLFYFLLIFYCLGFSLVSVLYSIGLILFSFFNFSPTDFSFNVVFAFSLAQLRRYRFV